MILQDPQAGLFLLAAKSLLLSALVVTVFAALRWQPARRRATYLLSGLVLLLGLPLLTELLPPLPWLHLRAARTSTLAQEEAARAATASSSSGHGVSNLKVDGVAGRYEGRHLTLGPVGAPAADASETGTGFAERVWSKVLTAARPVSLAKTLGVFWLVGSVLFFLRLVASLIALERLRRRSRPIPREALGDVQSEVEVMAGPVNSPLTFGLLRPAVVVPAGIWRHWSREQLDVVLRHETEHIARRDWLSRVLAEAAVVVYWFNPLVWLLRNRLRLEQELSCDEAVLEGGGLSARRYGEHLLDLAEQLRAPDPGGLAVGMAKKSTLEQRIMSMTRATSPSRTPLSILGVLLLVVAAPTVAALKQQPASSELRDVLRELEAREARMEPFHREMETRQKAMEPYLERLEEKAHQMEAEVSQMRTAELQELEREMAARARRLEELHEPFAAASEDLQQKLEAVQQNAGTQVEALALEIERSALALSARGVQDEASKQRLEARAKELEQLHDELNRKMEPALEQLRQLEQERSASMRGEFQVLEREMAELASKHDQLLGGLSMNLEPLQDEMDMIQSQMLEHQQALEAAHREFEQVHEKDREVFERLIVAQRNELALQLGEVLGISLGSRTLERIAEATDWRISDDRIRVRGSAAELEEILERDPAGLTREQIERGVKHLLELELQR